MPRGILAAMGLLVVLALLMLVFTPGAAGSDLVQSSGNPPVDALAAAGTAEWLTTLVNYAGLVGLVASFFSIIYAYSRQTFALSRAGYLPRALSVTNRRKAPVLALLVPGALGFVLSLTGQGAMLLNMAVFGATVSYVLMMVSHIVLRRREPDLPRPYRTPGGTATTGVALVLRRRRSSRRSSSTATRAVDARRVRGLPRLLRPVQPPPPRRRCTGGGVRGARRCQPGRAVTVRRTTLAGRTWSSPRCRTCSPRRRRCARATCSPGAPPSRRRSGWRRRRCSPTSRCRCSWTSTSSPRGRRRHPAHPRHPRPRRPSRRSPPDGRRVPRLAARRAAEGDETAISGLAKGLTPEMVAATSKLMRNADLVAVGRRARVVTGLRSTLGLPGRLASRLQPNHPTDDAVGVTASVLDGLLHGCGDAVIGINPATDSPAQTRSLLELLAAVIERYEIPTQSCVLAHVTTTLRVMEQGAPVDLVFQSVAGTEGGNRGFGVTLDHLAEARAGALELGRGTVGRNVTYFETGQGSALSADAHYGVDGRPSTSRRWSAARTASPATSSRCSSTPSSASSARSTSTTASRSSGPAWRTTSAASCSACRWASTSATRTTRTSTATTPTS
jgi:hypothetical protein